MGKGKVREIEQKRKKGREEGRDRRGGVSGKEKGKGKEREGRQEKIMKGAMT
jgi:hypothetical protein